MPRTRDDQSWNDRTRGLIDSEARRIFRVLARRFRDKMLFKGNSSRLELLIGKIQAHKEPSQDEQHKSKGLNATSLSLSFSESYYCTCSSLILPPLFFISSRIPSRRLSKLFKFTRRIFFIRRISVRSAQNFNYQRKILIMQENAMRPDTHLDINMLTNFQININS